MSLLKHAPQYDLAAAEQLARTLYAIDASASLLPSERDQNFALTTAAGERYVLKIANGAEDRAMLDAQNAAMVHVADRVTFCPRVLPTIDGETIGVTPGDRHLVRLVTYLAGVPLAQVGGPEAPPPRLWRSTEAFGEGGRTALHDIGGDEGAARRANLVRTSALFESLGGTVGRLDAALADFDHPAAHRDFHWDLARAARVIRDHLPRVRDAGDRALVAEVSASALSIVEVRQAAFRRSVIHNDANDWNVLVDGDRVAGIIDFGDMVHSWTVADLAVAAAYAVLDDPDPLATAAAIARGYQAEYPLRDEEVSALMPLVSLRLCLSACIAAWQQAQRPDDEYLAVSQDPIRRTLPRLAAISHDAAARALRSAT